MWTAIVVAVCLVIGVGVIGWFALSYFTASINTIGKVDFDREVDIPPVAESQVENGVRVFDLTMQRGDTDLGQDALTPTWGINGSYLAPTIRAERGEHVQVRVTNELGEASTLHWHGIHLPAAMDGGPHQMVAPGQTWTPDWHIDNPPRRSGITLTRTARPPSMSTADSRECSSSTTPPKRPSTFHATTAWTTSR